MDERWEEPAQAARGTDHPGHRSDVVREPLRDELEDGSGCEAQRHGHREARDRQRDHVLVARREHDGEGDRRDEADAQDALGADAIGKPAADGSRDHREQREAGRAVARVGLRQLVHAREQLGQVEEHRHEAAERQEVEQRRCPCAGVLAEDVDRGANDTGCGGAAVRGSRATHQNTTAITAINAAATQKGVAKLQCLAIFGAVSPASTVPPMPIPYRPRAKPWRSVGYQRLTNGTPTANEAPVTPSRKPITTTG